MKNKEKIIVIGSGGHAKVVVDIIEEANEWKIEGIVTKELTENRNFRGYPVLGNESVLTDLIKDGYKKIALGIGGFKDNKDREKIYNNLKTMGFECVNCIHPKSAISKSVKIGKGCTIFAGVVINPDVIIKDNVIIATNATVDHDTIINNHVLVSAGVTVGANITVGEGSLLALGVKIVSHVKIGNDVLIGAGAVVIEDCLEEGLYIGIPARLKKCCK